MVMWQGLWFLWTGPTGKHFSDLSWVSFWVRSEFHRCVKSESFEWDVCDYIVNRNPEDQSRWDRLKTRTTWMKKCHWIMCRSRPHFTAPFRRSYLLSYDNIVKKAYSSACCPLMVFGTPIMLSVRKKLRKIICEELSLIVVLSSLIAVSQNWPYSHISTQLRLVNHSDP